MGPCYVLALDHPDEEESMIKWTDDGEDRFIIRSEYNAGLQKISSLGLNVFNALEKVLSRNPGPVLEEVSLLGTLDIFAGWGGFSTGLGQAGVAEHKWAIEFRKLSDDAYKKNKKETQVFNEDCNGLLKKAIVHFVQMAKCQRS